jgi:butyryl-CoA dehydrogenase
MFQLPEETKEIQAMAREFAQEYIMEGAAERDRTHEFPAEIVATMGENGFMGMFVPEEYGGLGLTVLDYVVALEEICYADAGVGVIMSVNNSLAGWPILKFGTEDQKQKYLRPIATGEKIACYALTEPNAGSDAGSQQTKYIKDGTNYIITGTKMWITNGPQAQICVTYANKDPKLRSKGVSAFIVETSSPGFSVGKVEEKLGIACSGTSELVFRDMEVPNENLLFEEDKGFTVAMATLDGGRVGIAAQALGIAQRSLDLAIAYAKQREQFGKPIAKMQAIQWMIANMKTKIEGARLLTWKAATVKDREMAGESFDRGFVSRTCSMAKLAASECANFCADKALQIHGGYGYSKEYEVERLFRDARITTLYEGTSEIQRLVIALSLLK